MKRRRFLQILGLAPVVGAAVAAVRPEPETLARIGSRDITFGDAHGRTYRFPPRPRYKHLPACRHLHATQVDDMAAWDCPDCWRRVQHRDMAVLHPHGHPTLPRPRLFSQRACAMCFRQGVHDCPGGDLIGRRPWTQNITVLPGSVDASAFSLAEYERA